MSGMIDHPSPDTLIAYAERRLSSGEMTNVILHLAECAECLESVRPAFATARTVALFDAAGGDAFHLDFDEHLRPFVDSEADAVTRELVESHILDCPACAFELRELREFSESLRLREFETAAHPTIWAKIGAMFNARSMRFAAALVLLLFVAAAVYFVWPERRSAEIVSTADIAPNISDPKLPLPEPSPTPGAIVDPEKTPPAAPEDSENLPDPFRAETAQAVRSGRLSLPGFLAALGGAGSLRGGGGDRTPAALTPNGEAVRSAAPLISWNGFAEPGEGYTVAIYDENGDLVEQSPTLDADRWKPSRELVRGRVYDWEVRSAKSSKAFAGRFRVIDRAALAELGRLPRSTPFARGVALANRGLLTEAAAEFRRAIRTGDNVQTAKKFLRQIGAAKRGG
ncbi:MAG: hypothetical protein IPJ30_02180 [Acidobacteria bacterium]|nr:hypothetical protein [Acidobacteriota bacterium]